jgi:hypothetical protein
MSRYMVRRTRSFIKNTYAKKEVKSEKVKGKSEERFYLEFADGRRSYFPVRRPRTVRFTIGDPQMDPYAQLYSDRVVDVINALILPRYGLGLYENPKPKQRPTDEDQKLLANLSHAGQRLMGFCRTNLFKRLESSGAAFLQSLERHILRNYVYLHAIAHDLPLPIGTQDAALLDEVGNDEDEDSLLSQDWEEDPHPLAPSPREGEGEPESLTPRQSTKALSELRAVASTYRLLESG